MTPSSEAGLEPLGRQKTAWFGAWSSPVPSNYISAPILKKDLLALPLHSRLVIRKNKFYQTDTRRPLYIFKFVSATEAEVMKGTLDVKARIVEEEKGDIEVVEIDRAVRVAMVIAEMAKEGHDIDRHLKSTAWMLMHQESMDARGELE